jgi:hypothetical protein
MKNTREQIQAALDSLNEGLLGSRKDHQWDRSMTPQYHLNTPEANAKRKITLNTVPNKGGESRRIFTVEDVLKIKKLYVDNVYLSAADLARQFKSSTQSIINLLSNIHYKENKFGPPVEIRSLTKKFCQHCNQSFNLLNYKKWHGDKCKESSSYTKPKYTPYSHFSMWKELSTGFEGTNQQMYDRFIYINTPSMMNSNSKNRPILKGKNKGLQFIKL